MYADSTRHGGLHITAPSGVARHSQPKAPSGAECAIGAPNVSDWHCLRRAPQRCRNANDGRRASRRIASELARGQADMETYDLDIADLGLDLEAKILVPAVASSKNCSKRIVAAGPQFFGDDAGLSDPRAFGQWLAPRRECEWVVYAKRPFAGPRQVLAYLSRYTHRVAISPSRLRSLDPQQGTVTFTWKDYADGARRKLMSLGAGEFVRRFCLHLLPARFVKIRHYGLLGNRQRREHLAHARELLHVIPAATEPQANDGAPLANPPPTFICPHCGAAMSVVETLVRRASIRAPPTLRVAA